MRNTRIPSRTFHTKNQSNVKWQQECIRWINKQVHATPRRFSSSPSIQRRDVFCKCTLNTKNSSTSFFGTSTRQFHQSSTKYSAYSGIQQGVRSIEWIRESSITRRVYNLWSEQCFIYGSFCCCCNPHFWSKRF